HKPKSLFVDVTNYINLSFSRPLHAYDADKVNGNLVAKFANDGEKFKALNGEEYTLSSPMTVIADNSEPLAIAGVIGGESSASTMETTNVFLESAYFEPKVVISSGRKLCINTDSRYRFERGVDMNMTDFGLDYAAYLIQKHAGGSISEKVSSGSNKWYYAEISLNSDQVKNRTGIELSDVKMVEILESLGFSHKSGSFTVPSWRHDVTCKEDLIEEIARIYGYDNIPVTPLPDMDKVANEALTPRQKFTATCKQIAASRGFMEIVSWSFMDENVFKHYSSLEPIKLANPISSELNVMRPSIVPNLVQMVRNNEARNLNDMSIFEMGPIFKSSIPGDQENCLCLVRSGQIDSNHYLGTKKYNALDIKADVLAVLTYSKVSDSIRIDREVPSYYHPAKSGRITLGKEVVAYFGEIHPSTAKVHSLKQNLAMAEIFLDRLPEAKSKAGYKGALKLSDFPAVQRRFSFIINDSIAASSIINEVKKLDKNLIKEVKVFDYVKDLPILENGDRILGISISMQSEKETLSSEVIDGIYAKVIETATKMGAKFRDAA
ncbi:MAG: phenylalanine--tRNA ligase subunit beta, partial [Alphaproteobacteria bacterium]|nr:phenylalanine--tRNA ligase subunit beta [Alphaproteobacteria bacterium]